MKIAVIKPKSEDFNLEILEAEKINVQFVEKATELMALEKEFDEIMSSEMTEQVCTRARELRLQIVPIRTSTNKLHDKLKQSSLNEGRFIGAHRNSIKEVAESAEGILKKIENYFIELQAKAVAKLEKEREELLKPYLEFGVQVPAKLGEMAVSVWDAVLSGNIAAHDKRIKDKEEREAAAIETARIVKLHGERKELLIPYWTYLKGDQSSTDFGKIPEESFNVILKEVKAAKQLADDKQAKIIADNKKLKVEKKELKAVVKEVKIEKKELKKEVSEMKTNIIETTSPIPENAKLPDHHELLQEHKKMQSFITQYTGLWVIDKDPKTVTKQWIEKNAFRLEFK